MKRKRKLTLTALFLSAVSVIAQTEASVAASRILPAGMPDVAYTQSAPPQDPPRYGFRLVCDKSFPRKKFNVYDCNDKGVVYNANANPRNCFFVISKREYRIYVYERTNRGIELAAHFPVCVARNTGDKHRSGDGTTPVCAKNSAGEYIPFTISQIISASTWRHDFKDGRGNILAYGDWFMRLKLNRHPYVAGNTSIGIHGSSGNVPSVPGRDSEGCIRLRNDDLNKLRKFATVGMEVIIKPEDAGKLPYELDAQRRLGATYVPAQKGYVLPPNTMFVE